MRLTQGYLQICIQASKTLIAFEVLHMQLDSGLDFIRDQKVALIPSLLSIWFSGAWVEHQIQTTLSITNRRKVNLPSIALSFMLLFYAWGVLGQCTSCELVSKNGPFQKRVPLV